MNFSDLGLSASVMAAVEAAGYTTPTPIQAEAIPHAVAGRDVIGIAQTGTGKTAAFVLPMLTLLESGRARARMPRTLILEPTRELAAQVEENFIKYSINNNLNIALLIGGVSFDDQNRKLDRGADVLIATPGRLLDHFERGRLLLTGVEILVIDEADRMLDMGFIPDIERICKLVTKNHQTLFFSATMPPEIQALTENFLNNPVQVEVSKPASAATTVAQRLTVSGTEDFEKRETLRAQIAAAEDLKNAIVFCNRKRDVAVVFRSLVRHGFNVGALHGDMDQRARMATLDAFKKGTLTLLVASDVAARGLDIPDVSHVFNYDVPIHAEDYVHRIGRTGRAGRKGTAVMIVTQDDEKHLSAIEKLITTDIEWIGDPIVFDPEARKRSRGRKSAEGKEPRRSRAKADGEEARAPSRSRRTRQEAAPADAAEAVAEEAPRPSRSRTPRPEREAKPEREARPEREPKFEQKPEREPRPERNAERQPVRAGERPRNTPRRDVDDGPAVVGLGDHVPAFLLRPVRIAKTAG